MLLYIKRINCITLLLALYLTLTGCVGNDAKDVGTETSAPADETSFSAVSEDSTRIFETEDFSISLSDTWVCDGTPAVTNDANTVCYYFYRQEESSSASPSSNEHITVIINNMSNTGRDFATYKDMLTKQLESGSCTINTMSDTTVNGYEAWRLEYDGTVSESGLPYHNYLISMNVENVIYSFVLTSYDGDYEDKTAAIDRIAASAVFN